MVDFSDEDGPRGWIVRRPPELHDPVAARRALRRFPGIAYSDSKASNTVALLSCRSLCTWAVATAGLTPNLKAAATEAAAALAKVEEPVPPDATAFSAAAASNARGAQEQDALARDSGHSAAEIFTTPLWLHSVAPEAIVPALEDLQTFWETAPAAWSFWRRWYNGMLRGEPLPWDLQEQVALLPDEIWEAGPEAVAGRIAEIEARFEVKRRNEALEEELVRGVSQRLGIGGNNPPAAIDDLPPRVREETILILEPILDFKEQTDAPVADPGKIQRAISKLIGILAACGQWVGGKLDAAATEFAKKIGAWGAKGVIAVIAAHQLEIQTLIRAAADWLSKLPVP
ncbi:MAG: hypothetical protein AAGG09_23375 [Pseudomonadota bacterium]